MNLLKSVMYAAKNPFHAPAKKPVAGEKHHRVIFWSSKNESGLKKLLKNLTDEWQLKELSSSAILKITKNEHILWVLQASLYEAQPETEGHNGRLKNSKQGTARDLCGSWFRTQNISGFISFEFHNSSDEEIRGALIGLGLAQYKFLDSIKEKKSETTWVFKSAKGEIKSKIKDEAIATISAMNMARHLTNMPAGTAQPKELAECFLQFFKGRKGLKIEVLDTQKLIKEKMGLLVGVGQGSQDGAQLVHLSYRPKKSLKKKPVALVGKGVIFDTGGLDIKPSSGMRLMKKDMAGAAAVAGLCHFVTTLNLNTPCDFYLPLAENAISSRATRPGDVHLSRSGHLVEIDNTDAEGRLVMADAIDFALSKKGADAPSALYDISTLTGAMRVAVGLDVAGFFSNSDALSKEVERSSASVGEYAWRMPLLQKYKKQLSSQFADFKNSSESGFGGAITAALFLEKFVGDVPWVHFDVMSWNNSPDGAVSDGANAQCIQILSGILLNKK